MKPELVTRIAGECEENRMEREQLRVQLDILSKGLDTCKHFIGIGGLGKILAIVFVSNNVSDITIVTNTPIHQPNSQPGRIEQEADEILGGKF